MYVVAGLCLLVWCSCSIITTTTNCHTSVRRAHDWQTRAPPSPKYFVSSDISRLLIVVVVTGKPFACRVLLPLPVAALRPPPYRFKLLAQNVRAKHLFPLPTKNIDACHGEFILLIYFTNINHIFANKTSERLRHSKTERTNFEKGKNCEILLGCNFKFHTKF